MDKNEYDEEALADVLPLYYKRLFPFLPYYRWLSYGRKNYIERREISFTLFGDIYIRHLSFDNKEELIEAIQKRNPVKLDIGAIYTGRPKDRISSQSLQPVEKEIVFDIDMTDYDEVRTCCSGAEVCTKCWKFMAIACKILDAALREDFGFQHLLWVFSGRRGIHCWVCDEVARKLDTAGRGAVAEYLNLIKGGAEKHKHVYLAREQIHHSIMRALKYIQPCFEDIMLVDQDILGSDQQVLDFLKLIPEIDTREDFKKEMLTESSSQGRWDAFVRHCNSLKAAGTLKKSMRHLVDEIMLHYTYPRLDINVTKGLNHLLKSPFCIHPKTGKVCVPFNPASVDKFNPSTVPTINLLVDEINEYDAKTKEVEKDEINDTTITKAPKDYKKTSMRQAVFIFEQFLRKMENEWKGKLIEDSDKSMTF